MNFSQSEFTTFLSSDNEAYSLYLIDNYLNSAHCKNEISSSHQRSRHFKIDPGQKKLPLYLAQDKVQTAMKQWTFRKDIFCKNNKELYAFMQETKAAIFYTDLDLNVILCNGNSELIKELSDIGLSVGTSMKESVAGTNAAALASIHKKPCWVIGNNHYLDILKKYATGAYPVVEAGNHTSYMIFISQYHNINNFHPLFLSYFLKMQAETIEKDMKELQLSMSDSLLQLGIEQHNAGIIFVDYIGRILHINQCAQNIFKKSPNIVGSDFKTEMPELKDAIYSLKTGKSINLREITLKNSAANDTVYMDCQPICKELEIIGVVITITTAKKIQKIINKVTNLNAFYSFDDLIGTDPKFEDLKHKALIASNSTSNVLITGESGTGKELFAHAIHNASARINKPFVSVNCGAIPKELVASELFGYTEGAFTGARKNGATGKFELANGGTLFLDEIGEMPLESQSLLLRVLEEGSVTRLGSSSPKKIDVRFIAATNVGLWEAVQQKQFRLDLYYRLNVISLELVPIRKRKEDIILLAQHFINHFNKINNKHIKGLTPEAAQLLKKYSWPGNVRELRNIIERSTLFCKTDMLTACDMPDSIAANCGCHDEDNEVLNIDRVFMDGIMNKISENKHIKELMIKYNNNKSKVAQELGITRATLYKKLKLT